MSAAEKGGSKRSNSKRSKASRSWHCADEPDDVVFAVCQRFLQRAAQSKKGVATAIAREMASEFGASHLNRERVYALVWEGVRRGMVFFRPPRGRALAQRIIDIYALEKHVRDHEQIEIVNVRGKEAFAAVCDVGADLVLELIKHLRDQGRDVVHLGLGSGASAMNVAKRLSRLLRSEPECPRLVVHAISAGGFAVDTPNRDSPLTYFGFFEDILPEVEFVGLFGPTVVAQENYEQLKQTVGMRESFEKRHQIDIIVTSLARRRDQHGLLQRFLKTVAAEEELRLLEEADWVGEIQFRPFSRTSPIVTDHGVRAVTLFEIAELVELARQPGKYVVLLSAPCLECSRTRAEALQYLLREPQLRAWTHLVTDVRTAMELIRVGRS